MNMVLDDDFIQESDSLTGYFIEETLDLAKELGICVTASEILISTSVLDGKLAVV